MYQVSPNRALFLCLFGLLLTSQLTGILAFYYAAVPIAAAFFLARLIYSGSVNSAVLILILIWTLAAPQLIVNNSPVTFLKNMTVLFGTIGMAMLFFDYARRASAFPAIVYWGFALFVFVAVAVLRINPDLLVEGSKNQVGFILVCLLNLYFFSRITSGMGSAPGGVGPSLLPAAFGMICALLLASVTTILAVAVILVAVALGSRQTRAWLLLTLIFLMPVLLCLVVIFADAFFTILGTFLNFDELSQKLTSLLTRYQIWSAYLSQIDMVTFWTGFPLEREWAGHSNLHNAYLLMHSRLGYLSVLIVVFMAASFLTQLLRPGPQRLLAFNLLSFLLFGLTFTSFFAGGALDFRCCALLNPFVSTARTGGRDGRTSSRQRRARQKLGAGGSSGAQFILS